MSDPTLSQVARKRGWQALLQGLAIDIVVAVALAIVASVSDLDSWQAVQLFLLSLVKTVVLAAAQWVIRRYADTAGYTAQGDPVVPEGARRAA